MVNYTFTLAFVEYLQLIQRCTEDPNILIQVWISDSETEN